MATTTINVRTDSKLKTTAAEIFEAIGMDMSTAINIFLRQTVKRNDFPFPIGSADESVVRPRAVRPPPAPGAWKGKIRTADDFDVPLDDFEEYMQ